MAYILTYAASQMIAVNRYRSSSRKRSHLQVPWQGLAGAKKDPGSQPDAEHNVVAIDVAAVVIAKTADLSRARWLSFVSIRRSLIRIVIIVTATVSGAPTLSAVADLG